MRMGGCSLEDLFVKEEFRGQGIAKTLFNYLGQVAKEKDCPRMDWVVIDWNEVSSFLLAALEKTS